MHCPLSSHFTCFIYHLYKRHFEIKTKHIKHMFHKSLEWKLQGSLTWHRASRFQVLPKERIHPQNFHLINFYQAPRCCCLVTKSCLSDPFVTPWTVDRQAPLSKEFLRKECWSGLPFPSPEDFPDPGIECRSPALAGGFFTTETPGKPIKHLMFPLLFKCVGCQTQLWTEQKLGLYILLCFFLPKITKPF